MKIFGSKIIKAALLSPIFAYAYTQCINHKDQQQLQTSAVTFKTRNQHLQEIQKDPNYDVVVIGGGCNGAGVVLDASTRGLKTLLIQSNDFASGTSSKSTKLIHGGVRYLEQVFQLSASSISSRIQKLGLVTEAITERGVMIRNASYMNDKISFVIPSTNSFWSMYYYIGSVVYYAIYWIYSPKNTTKFCFPYFLHRDQLRKYFPFIADKYQSGVVYEDGCFNDSRMVLVSLLTSTLECIQHRYLPQTHQPSNILNKAEFKDFIKDKSNKIIGIKFVDKITGKIFQVQCKYTVNCTGTWSDQIRLKDNPDEKKRMCIVGGTHITYDSKIASNKMGLCLPSKDGRILLVVPWLKRVIVGTTQQQFQYPTSNPIVSKQQRTFIRESMGEVMEKLSSESLINLQIAKWSGLRPLVMNPKSENTKDIARTHVIQKSNSGLYSLMGGKWTTYRKMGEDLVNQIAKDELKNGRKIPNSCSSDVRLLGSCSQNLQSQLIQQYGPKGAYLYKTYGSLSKDILKRNQTSVLDTITMGELEHVVKHEMVNDVEDVLLRRIRVAFLYSKQATLALVPIVARLILKEQNKDYNEAQLDNLIRESANKIISYEYS